MSSSHTDPIQLTWMAFYGMCSMNAAVVYCLEKFHNNCNEKATMIKKIIFNTFTRLSLQGGAIFQYLQTKVIGLDIHCHIVVRLGSGKECPASLGRVSQFKRLKRQVCDFLSVAGVVCVHYAWQCCHEEQLRVMEVKRVWHHWTGISSSLEQPQFETHISVI